MAAKTGAAPVGVFRTGDDPADHGVILHGPGEDRCQLVDVTAGRLVHACLRVTVS